MTQYILSEIDPSVSATYGKFEELGLVNEGDRVDRVAFSRWERSAMKNDVSPYKLCQKYNDLELEDGLLVTLNGSGDYHHHTYGFCRGMVERRDGDEYTVFHYDQHGDPRPDHPSQPGLDCGNYLKHLVKDSSKVAKSIIIGATAMVHDPEWMDTEAFKNGVEVYPYSGAEAHFPCVIWEPKVDAKSMTYDKESGKCDISWYTVKEQGIDAITNRALERTPTKDVYITVDLDVLHGAYVTTDWDNGEMSLDELLDSIKQVREKKNIIGLDVNGTDGTDNDVHTQYTIAAIINEITDGPYERQFFMDKIRDSYGAPRPPSQMKENLWDKVCNIFS